VISQQGNKEKFLKKCQHKSLMKYIFKPWDYFGFGTACSSVIFAVDTGTTISCSLGRRYRAGLRLSFVDIYGLREISCQLLPAGGSMVTKYVWQLSFSEKSQAKNSTTTKAREKISTNLESLEFKIFLMYV
jgi:hypothetical protein